MDTQWIPARVFSAQSEEAEGKFNKLTQFDEEALGSGVELLSQKAYSEVLAPVYDFNDFSTEYSARNTGPNLTG